MQDRLLALSVSDEAPSLAPCRSMIRKAAGFTGKITGFME
jgi:hypothetical protein